MADLQLTGWPIASTECIGDSLQKINSWFNSLKDFANTPLLKEAIWITASTTALANWHGRVVIAVNSTANTTLNIALPSGLPVGYDLTVIRVDKTNNSTGKVAFQNIAGQSTLLSTPDSTFRFIAFNYSVAGLYHPGNNGTTTLLNNFILFGDLLPS